MTYNERQIMVSLADTIKEEINRMCVTKELAELDTVHGHAKRNLNRLLELIYDCKFKTKSEEVRNDKT